MNSLLQRDNCLESDSRFYAKVSAVSQIRLKALLIATEPFSSVPTGISPNWIVVLLIAGDIPCRFM